jgi:hypothetical protein
LISVENIGFFVKKTLLLTHVTLFATLTRR